MRLAHEVDPKRSYRQQHGADLTMPHDRGVILDVDGTLIDSNDAHAHAWVDAAHACDRDLDFDAIRPLIGMGGDRVLPLLFGLEAGSAEGKALSDARSRIFQRDYLPDIRPFPDVRALVDRLLDDAFDVVVASSAGPDDLSRLLGTAGVADLIRSATSAGDVDDSKPAPDIVESAVGRAHAPREGLVMVGDTPYDVEAARRARVPVIGVRSGGWDEHGGLAGAALVYEDTGDLLAHYLEAFLDAPYRPA
jgi:phosphoglycolate phosphatase-like HAD superfamily hydrolase